MAKRNDQDLMHPHLKIILKTAEKLESPAKKVWINKLKNGDVVRIETLNTLYELKVVNPRDSLAEVTSSRDHGCFPGEFRVLGPVVAGFGIYLESKERDKSGLVVNVSTSAVKKIAINDFKIQ